MSALDIDALTAHLGQPLRGAELEALVTAWRGEVNRNMFDDPPTTAVRLGEGRAALTMRDGIVIRIDVRRLEEAVWPSRRLARPLHDVARAEARAELGEVIDEQPASDTFRIEAPVGEPWRVTLHYPPSHRGGVLAGVDVELWSVHAARREAGRWRPGAIEPHLVDEARADIGGRIEPLSPAWQEHLPAVMHMRALFGLDVEDPRVRAVREALGLDLVLDDGTGALMSSTGVSLSVDGDVIWAAVLPPTWGGELEAGLRIGRSTRGELRARFGAPAQEDELSDTWVEPTEGGSLRRLVSYRNDVVFDYALELR